MTTRFGRQQVAAKTRSSSFTIVKMGPTIPSPQAKYTVDLQPNDDTMGHTIGSGTYLAGTVVEARAIAHDGYTFIEWSDGDKNYIRQIEVFEDIKLTAQFQKKTNKGIAHYLPNKDYVNP